METEIAASEQSKPESKGHPVNRMSVKMAVKKVFLDFCSSTSVHGMHYIGDRPKIYERIIWLICCTCALVLACFMVAPVVNKWIDTPIELTYEQRLFPINEISFPAITVCPQRLPNQKHFNYSSILDSNAQNIQFTAENDTMYHYVTQTCFRQLLFKKSEKLSDFVHNSNRTENLNYEILKQFLPSPHFSLFRCQGLQNDSNEWNCDLEFKPHLIENGLCYTFNMLPKHELLTNQSIEYPIVGEIKDKHESSGNKDTYKANSNRHRLEISAHYFPSYENPLCNLDFIVYVHNPEELPWDGTNKFKFNPKTDMEITASIKPKVINTEKNVKKYSPNKRRCYFDNERPLKYFQKYTKANCELECLTDEIYSTCNCVPYYLPRFNDTPLCTLETTLICARSKVITMEYEFERCNCYENCNSVSYDIKFFTGTSDTVQDIDNTVVNDVMFSDDPVLNATFNELKVKMYLAKHDFVSKNVSQNQMIQKVNRNLNYYRNGLEFFPRKVLKLSVHFEDSEFLVLKRYTVYTFSDFLSQLGGIFGGIMGFSLLSIIEIVYFCTIRSFEALKSEAPLQQVQN